MKKPRISPFLVKAVSVALGVGLLASGLFAFGYKLGTLNPQVITVKGLTNLGDADATADFGVFWQAWQYLKSEHVHGDEIKDKDLVYGATAGLVDSLKDPYTVFFTPEDGKKFLEDVSGKFGGIGAEIGVRNEQLVVIAPLKGTPAERAGLRTGEKILKIDDKVSISMPVNEAVKIIRGDPNTKVTLTITRNGWDKAKEIVKEAVTEVHIKSAITCKLEYGICATCYGWDFSTKRKVDLGVPVGVIAAQSIGEPGTQLTMKVKHFGGIVMSDVTQGLPRVEELFEMRTPKSLSPISEISGKVSIETGEDGYIIKVKGAKAKPVEEKEYFVPLASNLTVEDAEDILAGTQLAQGYLDPKEVIKIKGLVEGQRYIITEAQKVYESQGIGINDKHFETILRKMSDKVIVETVGDTALIPGDFITKTRFEQINAEVLSQGGEPATARQTILGITKSSLFSDSWLSASSFQETTKVLTDAALEGAEDKLVGLKENVIIGRLIPVEGTTPDTV